MIALIEIIEQTESPATQIIQTEEAETWLEIQNTTFFNLISNLCRRNIDECIAKSMLLESYSDPEITSMVREAVNNFSHQLPPSHLGIQKPAQVLANRISTDIHKFLSSLSFSDSCDAQIALILVRESILRDLHQGLCQTWIAFHRQEKNIPEPDHALTSTTDSSAPQHPSGQ